MDWLHPEVASEWRQEGKIYAHAINEFVRIGMASDWQEPQDEPEEDKRPVFAPDIMQMIIAANQADDIERLHEQVPPASSPITPHFEEQLQPVCPIGFIQGYAVVQAGNTREHTKLYLANSEQLIEIPNILRIGMSPDQQYIAKVTTAGISVVHNPDLLLHGDHTAYFSWEHIQQTLKKKLARWESLADCIYPEQILIDIIPFAEGTKVLLVSAYGIYLLEGEQVRLLAPELSEIESYGEDYTTISLDMAHGAVSSDSRWIAYGSQMSEHYLLDTYTQKIHKFEPASSYPHYSLFTQDNRSVWYNACHFYNGATLKVDLTDVQHDQISEEDELPLMDQEMRVYAGASLQAGNIVGDAYGYLRFIDHNGQELWRYFVGSTIVGIIVSSDEKWLIVGTYGGMAHWIDLQSGVKDEYTIGTAPISETSRWILWKNQIPLRW